jgi:hypothetical protein
MNFGNRLALRVNRLYSTAVWWGWIELTEPIFSGWRSVPGRDGRRNLAGATLKLSTAVAMHLVVFWREKSERGGERRNKAHSHRLVRCHAHDIVHDHSHNTNEQVIRISRQLGHHKTSSVSACSESVEKDTPMKEELRDF